VSYPVAGANASDPAVPDGTSKAKQVATQGGEAAAHAASDVKDTATEQAQRVGAEARTQARNVAADVRDKLGEHARTQNGKLVGNIRQTADQLDEMRGDRADTPAAMVVSRVADGGRQLADYLDRHGPDGVLREVQDFARRRPGAFLATALAAGFVVGRLGKSVAKADPAADGTDRKPVGDTYASGYSTATDPSYIPPAAGAQSGFVGTETAEMTGGYAGTTGQPASGAGYSAAAYPGTEYRSTGSDEPLVAEQYPAPGREPRR
jgi:hypothetical protein